MQTFRKILQDPVRAQIGRAERGGFFAKLPKMDAQTRTLTGEVVQVKLSGITEDLREKFWKAWVPPQRITFAQTEASASSGNGKAKKKKGKKGRWKAKREGLALGTRVHHELYLYTKVMDFSVNGFAGAELRLPIFESLVNRRDEGLPGRLRNQHSNCHPCTTALLREMSGRWRWAPISAEFCVGDIRGQLKYATQIDLVCVSLDNPENGKLILCEVKTGYNEGSFRQSTGQMSNFGNLILSNMPMNQAKVQLVLSAYMLLKTVQLPWSAVELHILHAPSDSVLKQESVAGRGGKNAVREVAHWHAFSDKVTDEERRIIVKALKANEFI